jgi:hypothetical protein
MFIYLFYDPSYRVAPTARRMHRGPKAGKITKRSSKKKSALHADEIFKNDVTTSCGSLAHLPTRLPMQDATTTMTQSENILSWVSVTFNDLFLFFSQGC